MNVEILFHVFVSVDGVQSSFSLKRAVDELGNSSLVHDATDTRRIFKIPDLVRNMVYANCFKFVEDFMLTGKWGSVDPVQELVDDVLYDVAIGPDMKIGSVLLSNLT